MFLCLLLLPFSLRFLFSFTFTCLSEVSGSDGGPLVLILLFLSSVWARHSCYLFFFTLFSFPIYYGEGKETRKGLFLFKEILVFTGNVV